MNRQDDESDTGLAARAVQGDPAAFTLLMRRHKARIYRLVLRYVGDPDDAMEIAQQAFVAAWRNLHRFDPERAFATWLNTIALNKCRDFSRRAKVRRLLFGSRPESPEVLPELPALAADPEAEAMARQELGIVAAALADLPHGLKAPLLLTVMEGMTTAEAALALGMTAKAAETRIYRARKALAQAVERRRERASARPTER